MKAYRTRFGRGVWLCGVMALATVLHPAQAQQTGLRFEVEEPASSGITWTHDNAMSETHYLPETMGGGVAVLDYDNNGWMDLYFVNSGPSDFFTPTVPLRDALYRNNGDGTFTDVTRSAGVEADTFGMGAAAGDFDNDGFPDLLVTGYGSLVLFHNQGDGTFRDVTQVAGVADAGWTTSAAWFDADNDGLLDLIVCRYVVFSKEQHISCGLNPLGKSYYCVPRVFDATRTALYRNRGDGTFEPLSDNAVAGTPSKALGVVASDVNDDGRMDLFIANDTLPDHLFLNRGDNRWEEVGIFAGVALSINGQAQSGMGVDAGDVDGDGKQDLIVTNIDHQYYGLFGNNGDETFDDVTQQQGVGQPTFLLSGWGVRFFDADNDGDLDLFLVNGHPDDMITEYAANVSYLEPPLIFENRGGRLTDVSGSAGPIFQKPLGGRGLALGDFDNDGRVDAVISNNGQPPVLLRNASVTGHHWLGVRLEGTTSNRQGVGARLTWSAGGVERSLAINGGGSYLSSHDPRRVLGLGAAASVDWVEVLWPGSTTAERFTDLPVDQYVTLRQGAAGGPGDGVRGARPQAAR